jgi:hypothetical protein
VAGHPDRAGTEKSFAIAAKEGKSEIAREALRRQLHVTRFENLRERIMPVAKARGYLTGDDVFADVSCKVLLASNVLAVVFATRGLCSDLLRGVLENHS